MKVVKIAKGKYLVNDYWLVKVGGLWELRNQVTGEVYHTAKTKRELINYIKF